MKFCDKVMYIGSSGLSILALALYLLFTPRVAGAQSAGCTYGGNFYSVGTCLGCGSHTGMLCYTEAGSTYFHYCGSCTF